MKNLLLTLRGLARAPLFTAVALGSLALGIGANTAIFSLLDRVLLRTLPVHAPHELVFLYHPGPVQGSSSTDEADMPSFSYPMFRSIEKQQTPFAGLAARGSATLSLSYNNLAQPGWGYLVSGNYFEVLGVKPALGRMLAGDDDLTPGGHTVIVVGYSYWTTRLGADPGVLNQKLVVNGQPFTIIGVAPKGFVGERPGSAPDVYLPIMMKKEVTPDWGDGFSNRKNYWVTLFARLKPGITREQAATAINVTYASELEQDVAQFRSPDADFLKRFRAKKVILKAGAYGRGSLREEGKRPLTLLMAMTILVLLISCANVANLQLARAAARTREFAVRLAMGASRGQLVRQLLLESFVLAVGGGLLGLVAAYWTLKGVLVAVPSGVMGVLTAELDIRVLLFCAAVSVVAGVISGLFPAVQSSRADLATSLKDQAGQISSAGSATVFRKALVTAQVAVSLLLLISAGLFAKSLANLGRIDLGLRADNLLTFALTPKLNNYTDERTLAFYEQLTERLRSVPGASLVSSANVPAIAGHNASMGITVEGFTPNGEDGSDSFVNAVGPDYFRTMGIPLVAGREFRNADHSAAPKVAVVNEAFVRHFARDRNPIGLRIGRGTGNAVKLELEIVGVVRDNKYSDLRETPRRVFYTPYRQQERQSMMYFYLRTMVPPGRVAPTVRREVAALDPNLPLHDLKTMRVQLEENLFAERMLSMLTSAFAGLATLLAAVGLYGVLAFNVARRTREIGIRMALGAASGHVRGLVVREIAIMLAIGFTVGLAAAAGAARLFESVLYGMKPWDPFVYGAATVLLAAVAMAAAYVPARRATRVEPLIALRYE